LESLLYAEDISTEPVNEVRLLAEEGLSNIIHHAYDDDEHPIEVTFAFDKGEIYLEIKDDGKPFDPTKMSTPDPNHSEEERTEGGWGIQLIRTLADEVSYAREGGHNILRLKKRC
jgi:anti-sigma regulatory factor (Ser/Thr protein kinase)